MSVAVSRGPLVAPGVPGPEYDRSRVSVGVVHFGVGGFHRAHQAMYHDALMNAGGTLDWGICGVGVLEGDRPMKAVLGAQDGLYTLTVKHADGRWEPRVIGSLVEYRYAPDDPGAVLARLRDERTRVVSLTITEGGYAVAPDDPRIAHDLEHPGAPVTAFGFLCEALRHRRAAGAKPFTVMSCDNLQGNGTLAREAVASFARLGDPDLADWIEGSVAFPDAMVDRITPQTTDADRAALHERFGIDDGWPVVCEPFHQWVLEDRFGAGRPAYEAAGVQVVSDVAPYEQMKLRLLNASHQALCYLAYLAGYRLVHEAAQDEQFARFLRGYMDVEATPTLAPLPGVDLDGYKTTLIERFSNPEVRDTVARLCAESSDRIPTWLVPVIRAQLACGGEVRRAAAVVASWARYAEGVDEAGEPIEVVDRLAGRLRDAARRERSEPGAFVAQRDLFGDLAQQPRFMDAYLAALGSLHERGARATLATLAG